MSFFDQTSGEQSFINGEITNMAGRGIDDLNKIEIHPGQVLLLSNNKLNNFKGLLNQEEFQSIKADNNQFEVFNPQELKNCSNLISLDLSANSITKIPDLKLLPKIQFLNFSKNRLNVLENLENSKNIRHLYLSRNRIHSIFLRSSLDNLTLLDLRYNQLSMISFGQYFPNLTSLYCDHCYLSSLSGLNDFPKLKRLSISFNKINDSQPLNLPSLQILNISNNNFTSLASIVSLKELKQLDISMNPIEDDGLQISSEPGFLSLTNINASGTHITSPLLFTKIAPNLEVLDLAGAHLVDISQIVSLFKKATNLILFDARMTPLTKDIYPDGKGQTLETREEFTSINDYNELYPENFNERKRYRDSLIKTAPPKLDLLDGIHIIGNEAGLLKQSVQHSSFSQDKPSQKRSPERKEIKVQTKEVAESTSEAEQILGKLRADNEALQKQYNEIQKKNSQIKQIKSLIQKQNDMRSQLGIPLINPDDIDFKNNDLDQIQKRILKDLSKLKKQIEDQNFNHKNDERVGKTAKNKASREHDPKNKHYPNKNENPNDDTYSISYSDTYSDKYSDTYSNTYGDSYSDEFTDSEVNDNMAKSHQRHSHMNSKSNGVKPDKARIEVVKQMISENAMLRQQACLPPLNYFSPEEASKDQLETIICDLIHDNDILRKSIEDAKKNNIKELNRKKLFQDLQGDHTGCTFWVDFEKEKDDNKCNKKDVMNSQNPFQLPVKMMKKKVPHGCEKCEKTILMLARVPSYPAGPQIIEENSNEFELIVSWISTSLRHQIKISALRKAGSFFKFIEMERTMSSFKLYTYIVDGNENANQILESCFTQPVIVASHAEYIEELLKKDGKASILLCIADEGIQAENYCEHRDVPQMNDLNLQKSQYHSLKFKYQGHEAIYFIDVSRILPFYSIELSMCS